MWQTDKALREEIKETKGAPASDNTIFAAVVHYWLISPCIFLKSISIKHKLVLFSDSIWVDGLMYTPLRLFPRPQSPSTLKRNNQTHRAPISRCISAR